MTRRDQMLVWDIKHQLARWAHATMVGDRVTLNLILERLTIRLEQADDPLAVMAATKRDDIVALRGQGRSCPVYPC